MAAEQPTCDETFTVSAEDMTLIMSAAMCFRIEHAEEELPSETRRVFLERFYNHFHKRGSFPQLDTVLTNLCKHGLDLFGGDDVQKEG